MIVKIEYTGGVETAFVRSWVFEAIKRVLISKLIPKGIRGSFIVTTDDKTDPTPQDLSS